MEKIEPSRALSTSSYGSLRQVVQRKGESYHTVPPRPPASILSNRFSQPVQPGISYLLPLSPTFQYWRELTEGILTDSEGSAGVSTTGTASVVRNGLNTGTGGGSSSASSSDDDDQGDLSLVSVPVD